MKEIRLALSKVNPQSKKFELGNMGDASEAFDEIMSRIGQYIKNNVKQST